MGHLSDETAIQRGRPEAEGEIMKSGYFQRWINVALAAAIGAAGAIAIAPFSPASVQAAYPSENNMDDGPLGGSPALNHNPDLTAGCGTDVVVILDESGSIGTTTGAVTAVTSATVALVDGLVGTGSRMRFVEFNPTSRDVDLPGPIGTGFAPVNAAMQTAVDNYFSGAGSDSHYNPSGLTNWEAALGEAASPGSPDSNGVGAPLVVFITDGDPTTSDTAGGNNNANDYAQDAIQEIQALQDSPESNHVLAIAVGAGVTNPNSFNRLRNLVEPHNPTVWSGPADGPLNLLTTDALKVNLFSQLESALAEVASALCSSQLNIRKLDQDGNPIANTNGGWEFTTTVESVTGDGDFVWQVPTPVQQVPPAPTSRSNITDADEYAEFKWFPGEIGAPTPSETSEVTFTETLPPQDDATWGTWTVDPSTYADGNGNCTVSRPGETVPNVDLVKVSPPGTPTPGQTVEFSLGTFRFEAGDQVNCDVTNTQAAKVTIAKEATGLTANPDPATDFAFTGGLGAFNLDDDNTATLPSSRDFFVAPGKYTVAETQQNYWDLIAIECVQVVGDPTSPVALPSVEIDVDAGDEITCTFKNTERPTPALVVTKTPTPGTFAEQDGSVTYGITIHNPNGAANPVTLTSLNDAVTMNGGAPVGIDLSTGVSFANVTNNTCDALLPPTVTVVSGTDVTCQFTVGYAGMQAGDDIDDTITAAGTDKYGQPVQDAGSAEVDVTPTSPQVGVVKDNVNPGIEPVAPGGEVSYKVTVFNPLDSPEDIWITGFTDQMLVNDVAFGSPINIAVVDGVIVKSSTCVGIIGQHLPAVASPGPRSEYTCEFRVDTTQLSGVNLVGGDVLENDIRVDVRDDDPDPQTAFASDDAERDVLTEPAKLTVFKTDNDAEILEPGQNITYDIVLTNESITEPLTITSIIDTVWFNEPIGGPTPIGAVTIDDADGIAPWVGQVSNTLPGTPGDLPGTPGEAAFIGTTCDAEIGTVLAVKGDPDDSVTCTITLYLPADAGTLDPDTRDKYNDEVVVIAQNSNGTAIPPVKNNANTPATNADPSVEIQKSPDAVDNVTVPETGGWVTFTFAITNTSGSTDPVVIDSLGDTVFGSDLFDPATYAADDDLTDISCLALEDAPLAPGATTSCQVSAFLTGDYGTPHTNTATVVVSDDEDDTATDNDGGEVGFDDVKPIIEVEKTANPTSVDEYGESVTFTVKVTNLSPNEDVWITELRDSDFGILTDAVANPSSTCQLTDTNSPGIAANGGTYTCTFVKTISQDQNVDDPPDHMNTVYANADDDEGTAADEVNDSATVTFTTNDPVVEITKSDDDATIPEPGGDVAYTLVIHNSSPEPVTITELTDTINYTNPVGQIADIDLLQAGPDAPLVSSTCAADIELAADDGVAGSGADQVTCTFIVTLTGTAQLVDDVVSATVVDNDDENDTETAVDNTPITDVEPTMTVTKTPDQSRVEPGVSVEYTFLVTNTSPADELTLLTLVDDKFGDIAAECGIDPNAAPPTPAPLAADGGTFECKIDRVPNTDLFDPKPDPSFYDHENEVEVTAQDDEIAANPELDPIIETADATVEIRETGSISVIKDATPAGVREFTFQLDESDDQTTTQGGNGVEALTWDQLDGAVDGGARTYALTEIVPTGWALQSDISCVDGDQEAVGSPIADGVSIDLAWGQDVTCTFDNRQTGDVTATKALTSGPAQIPGTNKYQMTYQITVTNNSYEDETFDVDDELTLPAGATVTVGTIISNPAVGLNQSGNGTGQITNGTQDIAARTVQAASTVVITVPIEVTLPGATALGGECDGGPDGVRVVLNAVDLDDEAGTDDETCTELPDPSITQTKSVDSVKTGLDNGVWTIVYDVVVTNAGNGPGVYSTEDVLNFGDGVTITDVDATVDPGVQTDPAVPTDLSAFDGQAAPALATNVEIVGNAVHTYEITVTATIGTPVPGAGTCDTETGTKGGFLNIATLRTADSEPDVDRACEPFSTITLIKNLPNNNGGNALISDFTLSATPAAGGAAVLSGSSPSNGVGISADVEAGNYRLAETPAATNGYTTTAWTCEGLTVVDGVVTVGVESDVVCQITNDDQPVDLELTKDDGGIIAVAGGAPFVYTITVENIGDRDADIGEDVTVVDVLPAGLTWAGFPAYCDQDGQNLVCNVDPALLTAGASTEIVTTVYALADAPAGFYTNTAWVTTDDDPVCDTQNETCDPVCEESCTPPPCPVGTPAGSNVGCDTTPVDNTATLSMNKSDNVANGVDVEPGDTYSYNITVTNNGPQPVDNIHLTDTVPSMLSVNSVTGAGWNCAASSGNSVSCTYGPQLSKGASANVVTVNVTLDPDFVGDNIANTGVADADVVKPEGLPDEKTDPVDDTENTPVRSLDVAGVLPTCVADSPYIEVDISALGFDPGDDQITLTFFDKDMQPLWTDADGNIVAGPVQGGAVYTTTVDFDGDPLSPTGQRVLFPGASLDPLDWPGWKLENGVWVEDPSDAFLRDGVFIKVDINPTAITQLITYPPASSACANPEQTSADLEIEKTSSEESVTAGDAFDWILDVTNIGPNTAVDVVVGDLVPDTVEVKSVTSSQFNCINDGNEVSCTKATMAVNEKGTITINVVVPADSITGSLDNVATVESNVFDPDTSNNSDEDNVGVVSQASPTTQAPPPVSLPPTGSSSTYVGIQIGFLLLAAGVSILLIARRRRAPSSPND